MTRHELRQACLARLDECAEEHPCGHQRKLAARYLLRARSSEPVELMFEKGPSSAPNIWVEERHVGQLLAADALEYRHVPASRGIKTQSKDGRPHFGRHSALKPMPKLRDADLVCVRITTPGDLERILDHLSMRGTSSA